MNERESLAPIAPVEPTVSAVPPSRVYRFAWNSAVFFWAAAIAAVCVALADLALQLVRFQTFDAFTMLAMCSGAGTGAGAAALIWAGMVATTDLAVTEAHLTYRTPLSTVTAEWADVRAVRPAAFAPLGERLLVRHAGRMRAVPLSAFARDWRNAPLADDLRHHAPWLFERQAAGGRRQAVGSRQ